MSDNDSWDEEAWLRTQSRAAPIPSDSDSTDLGFPGAVAQKTDDSSESPDKKRKKKKKDELPEPSVVGGFAFYLSLAALLPSGILTIGLSLTTWGLNSSAPTGVFIGSTALGAVLAVILIRGHLSVLLHEFKHSLVSGLVGNKWKGMKIDHNSGHFVYSCTKATKHFHAFISLAPYIVPLFTLLGCLLAFTFFRHQHWAAVAVVGVGYGVDLVLNMRDISPIQTDITMIRGGYGVGLTYIAAWNLAILGFLLAWVFNGVSGLGLLLQSFAMFFMRLHGALR